MCNAITKKGTRCTFRATNDNGFCRIHQVAKPVKIKAAKCRGKWKNGKACTYMAYSGHFCGRHKRLAIEVEEEKKQELPKCKAPRCDYTITNKNKNGYCPIHVKLFRYDKPDDCPICLCDLDEEEFHLSCGHWVHRNCQMKWNDICSIFRQKIKLTSEEQKQMDKIKEERNAERERENMRIAQQIANEQQATIANFDALLERVDMLTLIFRIFQRQ